MSGRAFDRDQPLTRLLGVSQDLEQMTLQVLVERALRSRSLLAGET